MTSATIPAELVGKPLSLWQRALVYASGDRAARARGVGRDDAPLFARLAHRLRPGPGRRPHDARAAAVPAAQAWGRLHNFGSLRAWFLVHLAFGIGGPLLILFHSGFRLHSLNASVAFWCMVLVALSGGMGRYVYLRVYGALTRTQTRLWELEGTMESHGELHPFDLAPRAREWLEQYRRHPFARRQLARKLGAFRARRPRQAQGEERAQAGRRRTRAARQARALVRAQAGGRKAGDRQPYVITCAQSMPR